MTKKPKRGRGMMETRQTKVYGAWAWTCPRSVGNHTSEETPCAACKLLEIVSGQYQDGGTDEVERESVINGLFERHPEATYVTIGEGTTASMYVP